MSKPLHNCPKCIALSSHKLFTGYGGKSFLCDDCKARMRGANNYYYLGWPVGDGRYYVMEGVYTDTIWTCGYRFAKQNVKRFPKNIKISDNVVGSVLDYLDNL